ncbi:hypothetical protein IZS90_002285 [Escherichia coli]|jgi:hypothetical protein|uniref:hypothetical protein n=1 Tax=Enterobacteriaceae TaxID=543 RepID=UPI000A62B6C0|nr:MULTISPECIES: hypothetical protein [Enterobacteriaceae]QLV84295.1 hypothetical protein HV263_18735 [Enterobacter cloacae]HDG1701889.1 hypothetical protein [Kluyvera ascorbata]EFU0737879.1 hypothetical protein [Escherichia coli]EGH0620440.1 hypothetical protein [Escherichia coli]EGP4633322.1 hypothetical protein [Escherichia coli]
MSSNNYKTVRIGDGAISPLMVKVSNSSIEKHGATMPKMQPVPSQSSGSAPSAAKTTNNKQ